MNKAITLIVLLLLTLSFAACGDAAPKPTPVSPSSMENLQPGAASAVSSGSPQSAQNVPEQPGENGLPEQSQPQQPATEQVPEQSQANPSSELPTTGGNSKTQLRIKLTVDDAAFWATLLDNSAARDLYSRLPLTVSFEDYNSIEKIARLTEELDISDAPSACDPSVGSLAYYSPWGNLSLFYNDFRQSSGLVPLGELESGIETFAEQQGSFIVTIEKAE